MTKVRTALLGDIADVNWGDTSVTKASYVESGFPAFSATGSDGFLPYADFDRDAIVLSAIGARCGKTWFTSGKWSCIKNTIRYWSTSSEVDNSYLYWATLGEDFWPKRGAAQPFITIGDARRLSIPVPPIAQQRRIAAILDQADALRAKRREALAQLDSLTQSIFIEMFGDPRLNPKNWPLTRLDSLFSTSPIFGTMIPGIVGHGKYLCLRVANIQNWQLDISDQKFVDLPPSALDRHSVRDGDLLLARAIATQELLGKCIVARPGKNRWAFDSHLMRLRFHTDRVEPDFIRQALRTTGGRSIFLACSRKSTVQYNINTKEIAALQLPIPPLNLQQAFLKRLQAIDSLKTSQTVASLELDTLFASLQHRAFRGEL